MKLGDEITADVLRSGEWHIEVAGERIAADVSLSAMYDAKGERMRG